MKLICIASNYPDANNSKNKFLENPIWFMKPETSILTNNKPFYHPEFSDEINFETEIVFRISKVGKYIEETFASNYYDAVGVGFDFTAKDLISDFRARGLPWEPAKVFDNSCPISNFIPIEDFKNANSINFSMKKNGILCQSANISEMFFSIDKIIAHVSKFITLKIGDLIYTGTPIGVDLIEIGDILEAFIEDKLMLTTEIK